MPKYWFEQKPYGYGSIPVTWQGWLLLAALIATVPLVVFIFRREPLWGLGTLLVVVGGFLYVCWAKTEGGWRWR